MAMHFAWEGLAYRLAGATLALGLPIASTGSANAGEIGHYGAAIADVRDYVMPQKQGFYFKLYNYYYNTSTFKDRHGDTVSSIDLPRGGRVDINVDVNIYVLGPAFMWISDWKILGARYGAYV